MKPITNYELIYIIAGNYKSKLVTSDNLQIEFNKLIEQNSSIIKIYAIYGKGEKNDTR